MKNNILKNIIFIPILSVILFNINLRAEETEDLTEEIEQNLTELEELETMHNDDSDTQQDNGSYFKSLNLNEETLLQDDDKKEIRSSKAAKISENADLIFNIIESAKDNYDKIAIKNKKGKTEGSDQEGMKSAFQQIIIKVQGQLKRLSDSQIKKYRELLYLSLDWDKDTLKKFKEKLNTTIKSDLIKTATEVIIFGINIQINSEETLKIILSDSQTKKNLHKTNKKDLETIKSHINEIMQLRKEWKNSINDNHSTLLFKVPYEKAKEAYNEIKNIKTQIQQILEHKKQ